MNYKVSEHPLRLKEYGRNVQQMVEYCMSIENRDERTLVAKEIIRIMNALNPVPKDTEDYRRKLWDHLYMVSNYRLDVDAPFPPPERLATGEKQEPMAYYRGRPRYRRYGKNVELMIEKAIEMENPEMKKAYINLIANTMKQFLRNIDRDATPESVIAENIRELSNGKINVDPDELHILPGVPAPSQSYSQKSNFKRRGKKNYKSNNNRRNKKGGRGRH